MKKLKISIIILIIVSIIVTILLLFLLKKNEINKSDDELALSEEEKMEFFVDEENENNQTSINYDTLKPEKVKDSSMYFTVNSCIEQYMGYLQANDKESIYKILDNTYKEQFNVTEENVLDFVEKIEDLVILEINEMYVLQKDDNIYEYYINGDLSVDEINTIATEKQKFCITVKLDMKNMIYSIIPFGYGGPLYEEV